MEAIKADYDALSAEDQADLDDRCTHTGTGQPLGRVLESALWTVWSFDEADNTTTLPDGTYDANSTPALSSEYSKGKSTSSRNVPWSVKEVEVKDGKAVATILVNSKNYTGIMLHGTTYEKTGGASKTSEFANVPIDLNSTFYFNGVSSSMPVPIAFSLTTAIEEPTAPAEPERIDLTITNNTGMFKAVSAWLEIQDGKTDLVMALSGTGYHKLYKGTYEQAVANGDNTDNWVHGYQNAEGKWEFRIPIEDGETYVPCVAISNSYYQKYLNGQNALERAFYPRQFELDREAKTLVTGDYEFTQELTVTNNVKMFKVSGAALETVGGPNSNNYKANLVLTMGSDSFDKAYVGKAAEVKEEAAIAIGEGRVFDLPVKWVQEFGQPETLVSLLGEPFVVSFHSVKNDAWYERQFTVSEQNGTLVIDEVKVEPEPVTTGWVQNGSNWSYYDENGKAVTGWLQYGTNHAWYYFDENGVMQTGWVQYGTNHAWYYFDENGVMQTGWVQYGTNHAWYYFGAGGEMKTGWQLVGGKWYYMDKTGGEMKTGWLKDGGKWYYLNKPNGDMAVSKWIGNYYVKASGVMATSEWVDGGKYYVDANGLWVPNKTR